METARQKKMNKKEEKKLDNWLEKKYDEGFYFVDGGIFDSDILKKDISESESEIYRLQELKSDGNTKWFEDMTVSDIEEYHEAEKNCWF